MRRSSFKYILLAVLFLNSLAFAQEKDLQATVDYKVKRMKAELKLTDSQADAVGPIIREYLDRRGTVLQETEGQGIIDHVAVKGGLKALKEDEYQKLGKILTEEQLKKWINKENLMAAINPDGAQSVVDGGTSLNANGANFNF